MQKFSPSGIFCQSARLFSVPESSPRCPNRASTLFKYCQGLCLDLVPHAPSPSGVSYFDARTHTACAFRSHEEIRLVFHCRRSNLVVRWRRKLGPMWNTGRGRSRVTLLNDSRSQISFNPLSYKSFKLPEHKDGPLLQTQDTSSTDHRHCASNVSKSTYRSTAIHILLERSNQLESPRCHSPHS